MPGLTLWISDESQGSSFHSLCVPHTVGKYCGIPNLNGSSNSRCSPVYKRFAACMRPMHILWILLIIKGHYDGISRSCTVSTIAALCIYSVLSTRAYQVVLLGLLGCHSAIQPSLLDHETFYCQPQPMRRCSMGPGVKIDRGLLCPRKSSSRFRFPGAFSDEISNFLTDLTCICRML